MGHYVENNKSLPTTLMRFANRPDSNAVLEVEGASKSYGELKALDEVRLRVHGGEFVALLGPNGAGKTTLFQLLTGLFVADEGRIVIGGSDIRRDSAAALARLGIVFQQATLDLDLSAEANLRFHARLHGIERGETSRRIREELERLGLTQQARSACRTLSGGNRRRVELARALLSHPELLLMDEATVGLDPASRKLLLSYVHDLCAERGLGVLWSTHLVDEAERAQRVLVLHRGKLLCDCTPAALVDQSGQADLSDAFLQLTGKNTSEDDGK
jgi:ABC-2 type transport system ATP-binding protein